MSSSVIESGFVLPYAQDKLNGELGLTLHEIAKSLQVQFKNAKQKLDRMIKDNRIVGVAAYTAANDSNGLEVVSYILPITEAKFFVAKYDNEIGDAYTRFLIQCESVLMAKLIENSRVIKRAKGDEPARHYQVNKEAAIKVRIRDEGKTEEFKDHLSYLMQKSQAINVLCFGYHEEGIRQSMTVAQEEKLNQILKDETLDFIDGYKTPTEFFATYVSKYQPRIAALPESERKYTKFVGKDKALPSSNNRSGLKLIK